MSIDPDAFRQMFAASEPQASPESEEPPMREEFIEPPIRFEEPPLSPQEIDAAAADELLKIAAAEEPIRIHRPQKTEPKTKPKTS